MARHVNKRSSSKSGSSSSKSRSSASARSTHVVGKAKRAAKTTTRTVTAPAIRALRSSGGKKPAVSAAAKQRLAIIEQAYTNGEISRREYDERRRSYEYFGQREAAGYPAFDLRY